MVDRDQEQIKRLMKRTKELQIEEEKILLRKRLEGQLLKFTNVVKGYQYRWCIVDPDSGTVEYYEKEEHKRSGKPRGTLNLTYASVCPSDEDSQAFVIHAANGDFLKLKAADAKERQFWVNRIRAVAEFYSDKAETHPTIVDLHDHPNPGSASASACPRTLDSRHLNQSASSSSGSSATKPALSVSVCNDAPTDNSFSTGNGQCAILPHAGNSLANNLEKFPVFCPEGFVDPRAQLHELFRRLDAESQALIGAVDTAAVCNPELTAVYKTLLLSKATSQATVSCLRRCMDILKRREPRGQETGEPHFVTNADEAAASDIRAELESATASGATLLCGKQACEDDSSAVSQDLGSGLFPSPILDMNLDSVTLPEFPGDAKPDVPLPESELGSVENQKHVILHLLSQLKLDMDLTKIVLPTFILEKRSLLEMFADYLAHPDLFVEITRGQDPEARMLAFVQWYLTSFHVGRKDKVARKPYNPVIGETFHCCWLVPRDSVSTPGVASAPSPASEPSSTMLITYHAEQVSHHPPVTAFHVSLPDRGMELNSSVHTKSKFHGLSISVTMLGNTVLRLGEHNGEEYHFSFPSAYAHSILTVPWFELGGKVSVTCPQTGCSAVIIFHNKPMRSNKLHRITAELFSPDHSSIPQTSPAEPFAKVSGEWNGILEFKLIRSKVVKKWSVDVNALPVIPKLVRPIDKQRPEESRCLWQHVTSALQAGNLQLATEKKRELEERQRISEKFRTRYRISFPVKHFYWNGVSWIFGHCNSDSS